jgi:hypothetical protein
MAGLFGNTFSQKERMQLPYVSLHSCAVELCFRLMVAKADLNVSIFSWCPGYEHQGVGRKDSPDSLHHTATNTTIP